MLTSDAYLMPTSLGEALAEIARAAAGSRIVAGATDTWPWAREGRAGDVHVPAIIDISRVAELAGHAVLPDGRLRLGAILVIQDFLADRTLAAHLPCMPYCAVWFADDQIRQQATLAGNIVNASPAADGTPPLLALDATVELARLDGTEIATRRLPLEDFVRGPGRVALDAGEILTAFECDSALGYGGAFEKVGYRRSLVISTVCAAAMVKPSADGTCFEDVRLAVAGIGPVPVRLREVEDFLRGQPIEAGVIAEAGRMPTGRIQSRTRRDYRRAVLEGFVARAIEDALADHLSGAPAAGRRETAHV